MSSPDEPQSFVRVPIWQIAKTALFLGTVGFGGGFAVVGRIKRSVVNEHRWSDEDAFVEQIGVANALPGTTATNLLTLVGYRLGGLTGAAAGAVGFITPSVFIMIAFAAGYDHLRSLLLMRSMLDGMSAAVVGVVASVAYELHAKILRRARDWALAIAAFALLAARVLTLLEVVAIAGVFGLALLRKRDEDAPILPPPPPRREATEEDGGSRKVADRAHALLSLSFLRGPALGVVFMGAATGATSLSLLLVFGKIGIATFGGGFAMIPAIARDVAERGWLDDRAFGDAIALGQVTPGPVAICATFVGYRVAGFLGAMAATVGMFAPPFVVTVLMARSLVQFRRSVLVQSFLRGIAVAVVGIIAAASVSLWRVSVHGALAGAIAVCALLIRVLVPKVSAVFVLLMGGVAALLASLLH